MQLQEPRGLISQCDEVNGYENTILQHNSFDLPQLRSPAISISQALLDTIVPDTPLCTQYVVMILPDMHTQNQVGDTNFEPIARCSDKLNPRDKGPTLQALLCIKAGNEFTYACTNKVLSNEVAVTNLPIFRRV